MIFLFTQKQDQSDKNVKLFDKYFRDRLEVWDIDIYFHKKQKQVFIKSFKLEGTFVDNYLT